MRSEQEKDEMLSQKNNPCSPRTEAALDCLSKLKEVILHQQKSERG